MGLGDTGESIDPLKMMAILQCFFDKCSVGYDTVHSHTRSLSFVWPAKGRHECSLRPQHDAVSTKLAEPLNNRVERNIDRRQSYFVLKSRSYFIQHR